MNISNILKIADFEEDQLSVEFVRWVTCTPHIKPTYWDQFESLNENIYNPDDLNEILDRYRQKTVSIPLKRELELLNSLMQIEGCSYFRIIKN